MADVFISYSRKDIAFARLLHNALKQNHLETWIDWQDIPPSADWLAEVYLAIEQADTFVFVISQDSVLSEICQLEIAHAVKNNKRLIPIVVNGVDPKAVPSSLSGLNWIFFREDEEFSKAFQTLIKAIQTDQVWVKEHTRLQVRALEWERNDRENSYLLTGKDLDQAEQWLSRAAEKDPLPTALHTQYILASRQAAARRQRVTLGAVLIGLVVAVALGIVAWTQRNQAVYEGHVRATAEAQAIAESHTRATAEAQAVAESHTRATAQAEAVAESHARATAQAVAEEQRQVALEQRNLAISRQLAAQAMTHLDDQLDLALLLSVEASQVVGTVESRSSLLTGLTRRPCIDRFLHGNPPCFPACVFYPQMLTVAFSPDGRMVASGNPGNTIMLWDVATGQPIGEPLTGHREEVTSVTFSPDGKILAAGDAVQNVILWDVASGEAIGQPLTGSEDCTILGGGFCGINSLYFGPDNRTLTAGCVNENIIIWDLMTGQRISEHIGQQLAGEPLMQHATAFSPDGRMLASGLEDDTIVLYDVETGEQIRKSPAGHIRFAQSVAFSPDGKTLACGNVGGKIVLWDVAALQPIGQPLAGHTESVNSVAFSTDGRMLASGSSDQTILLWNVETGEPIREPLTGHTDWVESVAFSPDGERLVSYDHNGTVILWDLTGRSAIIEYPIEGREANHSVAFNPLDGGKTLASVGCGDARNQWECVIHFWDVVTRQPVTQPLVITRDEWVGNKIVYPDLSPDTKMFATSGDGKGFTLWDTATGQPIGERFPDDGWPVGFSPDSRTVASGNYDDSISLWDVASHQTVGQPFTGHTDGVRSLAFSPDGKTLASADFDGFIILWDIGSRQPIGEFQVHREPRVVFSPDGKILASGGILWDVVSGQPITTLPGVVAFSPDGTTALSTSYVDVDGYQCFIVLWDVASRQPIGPRLACTDRVTSVVFSPDGKILASGHWSGITLRDVSLEAWQDHACHIANRNLTPVEWATYLGDEPYHKTCPDIP